MKRMKLLLLILLIFRLPSYCPQDKSLVILEAPVIKPYEAVWNAHCYVETRSNPDAIGDTKLKKKSYGIVQIRETRLKDYYRQTGIRYTEKDMFDPVKSKEVFMFYATQIHPSDIERISREWNGGDRGMKKKSTKPYYKLILKALEKS